MSFAGIPLFHGFYLLFVDPAMDTEQMVIFELIIDITSRQFSMYSAKYLIENLGNLSTN